jgi:hypothetical protein
MKVVKYRDAVTGEYVTRWYAKEHPESTVSETVDIVEDEREFTEDEINAPEDE